ncbi:hypothetical protein NVP1187O_249 [Vibrio phage 1.187.O._10N.286.49.F1]|nr:hypothetical protein NVP1187O_249 [Vibrio phage 1.187.O._10N.286.49.F1]
MWDYEEVGTEQEYYDPCDHCCEFCESETGCLECNPDNLPTYG